MGNSIKGVVIGGVLFIAGIPLLFWNEGRSVKTTQALEEGAANCVAVPCADTIDAANEGKLIHVTGTAKTDDVLADVLPILGDIVGIGLGVVAFLISTAVALVVIAIAWLFYRPVLGIILLAAAVGLLVLLIKKKAAAKAAKAAAAPAPAAE